MVIYTEHEVDAAIIFTAQVMDAGSGLWGFPTNGMEPPRVSFSREGVYQASEVVDPVVDDDQEIVDMVRNKDCWKRVEPIPEPEQEPEPEPKPERESEPGPERLSELESEREPVPEPEPVGHERVEGSVVCVDARRCLVVRNMIKRKRVTVRFEDGVVRRRVGYDQVSRIPGWSLGSKVYVGSEKGEVVRDMRPKLIGLRFSLSQGERGRRWTLC